DPAHGRNPCLGPIAKPYGNQAGVAQDGLDASVQPARQDQKSVTRRQPGTRVVVVAGRDLHADVTAVGQIARLYVHLAVAVAEVEVGHWRHLDPALEEVAKALRQRRNQLLECEAGSDLVDRDDPRRHWAAPRRG